MGEWGQQATCQYKAESGGKAKDRCTPAVETDSPLTSVTSAILAAALSTLDRPRHKVLREASSKLYTRFMILFLFHKTVKSGFSISADSPLLCCTARALRLSHAMTVLKRKSGMQCGITCLINSLQKPVNK